MFIISITLLLVGYGTSKLSVEGRKKSNYFAKLESKQGKAHVDTHADAHAH
jgi:hypothetical protein